MMGWSDRAGKAKYDRHLRRAQYQNAVPMLLNGLDERVISYFLLRLPAPVYSRVLCQTRQVHRVNAAALCQELRLSLNRVARGRCTRHKLTRCFSVSNSHRAKGRVSIDFGCLEVLISVAEAVGKDCRIQANVRSAPLAS